MSGRLRQFLEQMVEARRSGTWEAVGRHYLCTEDLVLQEGRQMELGRAEMYGPEKHCFANAARMSIHEHVTYCEGYTLAAGVLPVPHAWCLDEDGKVIETTLRRALTEPETCEWFGVALDSLWCAKRMIEDNAYGPLLDDWTRDFALLDAPLPDEARAKRREEAA